MTDYDDGPLYGEYLNVGYQNQTNLINTDFCWGGRENQCSTYKECMINNNHIENVWIHEQGTKIFYLTNGYVCCI